MTHPNSFRGANLAFENVSIHYLLAEVMKFRKQLVVRKGELKTASGWNDAMNKYMVDELENLADTLESVTYHPGTKTLEELEDAAADTTSSLSAKFDEHSVNSDDILMPAGLLRPIVWVLDGSDPDVIQCTTENCPNDHLRAFITGLDRFFVEATRLDCRHEARNIPKYQSVILHNFLNELYTICQRAGGEVNRSNSPTGTFPSQEPSTFQGA